MIRLTTPQHVFTFPQDPSTYDAILVTLWQNGRIILEKTEEDMTFIPDKKQAWYRLSQEETKLFRPNVDAKVQVRVLTSSGDSYASQIIMVSVYDVLNDELLGG